MAHLGEVAKQAGRLTEAGIAVLVVTQAKPGFLRIWLKQQSLPFPIVSDPDRVAYRAFDLGRVGFWHFLKPTVLAGYLRLLFRGQRPHSPSGEEDVYQLGGDFGIDRSRRLVYSYPSREATDRPEVEAVIAAIQKVAAG